MAWSIGLSGAMVAPESGWSSAQVTLTTQPPMYGASDTAGAPLRSSRPEISGFTPEGLGVGVAVGTDVGVGVGPGLGVGVGVGLEVGEDVGTRAGLRCRSGGRPPG